MLVKRLLACAVFFTAVVIPVVPAGGVSTQGEIAYLKEGPTEGFLSIHIVDADGTNDRVVLADAIAGATCDTNTSLIGLTWSPDGTKIAYFDFNSMTVLDAATSVATPFAAPSAGGATGPSWSPSGDLIAASLFSPGFPTLVYSSDPSSTNAPTTIGPFASPGITWSRDASLMIGSYGESLGAMTPDGTSQAVILTQPPPRVAVWPALSPDGSTLAVIDSDTSSEYELALAPVTIATPGDPGSVTVGPLAALTSNSAVEGPPTWSPNSESLAYQRFDQFSSVPEGIFIVDVATGIETLLLGPDSCGPAWRPFGAAGGSSDSAFTVETGTGGATDLDPVQTSISVPVGGSVTITETPDAGPPPAGFNLAGWQVDITLDPDGLIDPADPVVLTFTLDGTLGVGPFTVFKNGAAVPDCMVTGEANPAPSCVESQGLSGDDWVVVVNTTSASLWQFGTPAGPTCTIEGTEDDDVIYGTPGDDVICGFGGDDRIFGLGGNDIILGGEGNDRLNGGPGDDQISGEAGNDRLLGRAGDDTLEGNEGNDRLFGGRGDDTLTGGPGIDRLVGGPGDDVIMD